MKGVIWHISTICVVVFFSCKKNKEVRQIEKQINDTRWEFYHAEDTKGNDITQQVLSDSVICECFEFHKSKKNDAVDLNASLTSCKRTYFSSYLGNWGVHNWREVEKELGDDVEITNRWADFGYAIGNMGNETFAAWKYLKSNDLELKENYLIDRNTVLVRSGERWVDSIVSYYYYEKK